MKWKSWQVMPDEMRMEVRGQLSTNYNLEDLDNESLTYVNRVAIQESCPKELEGWENSWAWLCSHFQEANYVKAKANKGNRDKKTLLHHSGSMPFSYRMEALWWGGPNFRRSTSLATFIFDLGVSWPSDDDGEEPVGFSGVHLPTSSRYSAQVCGSFTRCGVSNPDGDPGSDSQEEAKDILSRDGECLATGT
ncbi:unnamed protein product [Prunus armeniaca]